MSYEAVSEKVVDGVYCVVVDTQCDVCESHKTLNIPESEWLDWNSGETLIQNAIPSLSKEDRELLISATCGNCFEKMFAEDNKGEEEEVCDEDIS